MFSDLEQQACIKCPKLLSCQAAEAPRVPSFYHVSGYSTTSTFTGVADTLPKLTFGGTSSGDVGAKNDLTMMSEYMVSNIQKHDY